MIKALNGSVVTLTATDEDIVPYEMHSGGLLKVAGRNNYLLTWVSGTVKTAIGVSTTNPPTGYAVQSYSAAANWIHTANPSEEDGGTGNIHASGAGATFNITW
jgi:hypothetical protein